MTKCTFSIIHIRIVLKHLSMSEAEDWRSWLCNGNTSESYFVRPSWIHRAKLPQWTILTWPLPLLWSSSSSSSSGHTGRMHCPGTRSFIFTQFLYFCVQTVLHLWTLLLQSPQRGAQQHLHCGYQTGLSYSTAEYGNQKCFSMDLSLHLKWLSTIWFNKELVLDTDSLERAIDCIWHDLTVTCTATNEYVLLWYNLKNASKGKVQIMAERQKTAG